MTLGTIISIVPTLAFAQNTNVLFPQPNKNGDYNSIISKFNDGKSSPHLVWEVVSNELSCRARAGTNFRIVRKLAKGNVINVVGSKTVVKDAAGKPWLMVAKEGSAEDIKIRCFVRANKQFIKPIPYSLI